MKLSVVVQIRGSPDGQRKHCDRAKFWPMTHSLLGLLTIIIRLQL